MSYRTPRRAKKLDGLEGWLAERFRRHRGNADVVRQDLARERGLAVSLRSVERAVRGLRQALRAEARATLRFETPPGHQLQVDFGETRVSIGGERVRLYLFVATLGYSRRISCAPSGIGLQAPALSQARLIWLAGRGGAVEAEARERST